MRTIKKKLNSQRGASLTFALLLFLVCAVVGSVVLVAGTAASGRLSKTAEMDQRYYSVTSAADFLTQELSNKKITLVRTREVTESIITQYSVAIDEDTGETTTTEQSTSTSYSAPAYTTKIAEGESFTTETPGNLSFLTERAFKLLFGTTKCNTDAAWNCSYRNGNKENKKTMSMILKKNNTELKDLAINGSYELKKDGTLILVVHDSIGDDHYSLRITMKPSYNEWVNQTSDPKPNIISPIENGVYTVTQKTAKTETKTSEISWSLSNIAIDETGGA